MTATLMPVSPGFFRRAAPGEALPCGPAPARTTRIDPLRLPHDRKPHYQPSIVRYKGRLICAFRSGTGFSRIMLAELREDYQPRGLFTVLGIYHPKARIGQDDPRLFIFHGRLHVAFVGCEGEREVNVVSVLYARLTDDLQVEELFYPHYEGREPWEKNWSMFEHEGRLLCVYSILPHRVFEVDGETATLLHSEEWSPRWTGGLMRGGASPVRVGDEYWHWFHGWFDYGTIAEKWRTYPVGVYAFSAEPPFRPTRYTPDPLLWPDPADRSPTQPWFNVYFPCGAILDGDTWQVSYGRQEQFAEVAEWRHADVEAAMVPA